MALAHCILGKFLGVGCHCFPPCFTLQSKKKESIPFIFNDESTGSCIYLRLDLYMSHVKKKYITDTHNNNTCVFLLPPTHPATRAHTCAYITRTNVNISRSFEPRHVIPDTHISSGQCPCCGVMISRYDARDFQGHTI
jgi:hypothetical protein